MQSCSIHHCVLFFLTLTFTTASALNVSSVIVKLNETAVLPCQWNCSGLSKWTMSDKQVDVASCDQTCWSKEGFNISHDQYLKGDLSLTIIAADYSKRGWYMCQCNGTEIQTVRLSIETLMSPVHLKVGQSLHLDLSIPEPVEVTYKSTDSADPYGEQICNVTQHSLQCKAEYTPRVSLSGTDLTLKKVNVSDSGFYLIWDKSNNEIIHIYTLHVTGMSSFLKIQSSTQFFQYSISDK
ncbi:hypothetical protein PGIGA_G00144920 [Pangasianodon gigas]|uniref:Uncharacterized protein n=1 Tax=Pangasianodon gigas TaxID=30993 RepID=A0ACC5XM13_PANGG|nr:hypothetical protein [Pangasianodon gigas]